MNLIALPCWICLSCRASRDADGVLFWVYLLFLLFFFLSLILIFFFFNLNFASIKGFTVLE